MAGNLFAVCEPRADVLQGTLKESDIAADLSQVLRGDAPDEYKKPELFFANTYPTKGLKNVLKLVALRVLGRPEQVGAIFRLDTQFGGGKTHTLIGLAHAMRGLAGVPNADEFLEPTLRPPEPIRIAAFDGENADPTNGRRLSDSIRAFSPWGELAFALAGEAGYRLVEQRDKEGIAPGADTLRELLGTEPALILIDEIAPYLRKVAGRNTQRAGEQLLAFMTSLMKAVESLPSVALVFTLAVGRDGKATDAYSRETQDIAAFFAEAESVTARKATVIDPAEDDETVKVVCRRLFTRIDETKAKQVVAAYKALWDANRESLPTPPAQDRRVEEFEAGFPLHPELVKLLTQKTGTLGNFQRVRGMLRLPTDQPDSPVYVRDRTPLKKGQITTAALRNEFRQDASLPMLVGDDVFIKGIRQGIDQGDYVYKSGDLLRGKGDPHAEIKVDEQSFVFTASYAEDHGIWPRPAPTPTPAPTGGGVSPTGGSTPGSYTAPAPGPAPTANEPGVVQAEGVLKAALNRVFEQARNNGVLTLGSMTIRPFDKGDAPKLIPLVKSVPNASKRIELEASFETPSKSEASVAFKGDLDDAAPLKDYLEPPSSGRPVTATRASPSCCTSIRPWRSRAPAPMVSSSV